MCGIVAVLGQIGANEEKLFKQLLEVDSLRGRHSTGVVKVDNNNVVSTKKKAVDGIDFVKLESNWIGQGVNKVLIGHNRWATKGVVNDVNAHPFSHDHIHGVHNGTLHTQVGLKDHFKFEVDSDNIFYDIAHGTTEKTVERLRGAFAITLYNEDTQEVEVFRNEQRELSMAFLNNGRTVVIASEHMMLKWVLSRVGYHDKNGKPNYEIIDMLDTFKKITFKPNKLEKNIAVPIVKTMKISKLKKPEPVVYAAAKKPTKTLRGDYKLDAMTFYPAEMVEVRKVGTNNIDHEIVWRMLCAPWAESLTKVYTKENLEKVKNFGKGIAGIRVNIPFTPHPTGEEFSSFISDLSLANEKVLNLIEDEPKKPVVKKK